MSDRRDTENRYSMRAMWNWNSMPFLDDSYFDLIFCDHILEHVENPDLFYKEIALGLKPLGLFISKPPNRFYYVSIIAAITHVSFHCLVNKIRGRNESHTFDTFYKANTPAAQDKWVMLSGLKLVEVNAVEGWPKYTRIFVLTYLIGIAFERAIYMLSIDRLKSNINNRSK